jgi:3-oxoacyl-[acyl-carrier-protein] synthase-3
VFSRIEHISLRGVSACVPRHIVRTIDYSWISEDERKLFMKSTGVEERRVADEKTTASDLCQQAAEALIHKLQWEKGSIDALILVSQSPDYFLPASSAILQHKLGLKKSAVAFDINLGCSGYIYGLYVLSSLLSAGGCKRGILLAGDKSTVSTNFKDKSTYPLFGDAGTATAVEYDPQAAPSFFNLFTDGGGYQAIQIKDGGCRSPLTEASYIERKIEEGIERSDKNLVLDGIEVFNFALREVAPGIQELFGQSGYTADTIDYFVFHQANKLMNESVRKKCRVDAQKVPYSINKFGNTSSASVPLTLIHSLRDQLEKQKLNLLLSGFGVGFSWGNCILQTNGVTCTEILEAG